MSVLPLLGRSEEDVPRGEIRLGVAAELARAGRLQRDRERAQAHHGEVAQPGRATSWPGADRFTPAVSRAACFEDLRDLGLSANQARRVLQYLQKHSLVRLRDA